MTDVSCAHLRWILKTWVKQHRSQEGHSTPLMKILVSYCRMFVVFFLKKLDWYRVTSLQEYSYLQNSVKNFKIIASGTSRGVYKDEFDGHQVIVDITSIPELFKVCIHVFSSLLTTLQISHSANGLEVGAAASINRLMLTLQELTKTYPTQEAYFTTLVKHIRKIAGTPVIYPPPPPPRFSNFY